VLSQTVEYALRTVVYLAGESPAARTTDEIAAKTCVPKPYLSKVIQGLVRSGVLHSRRGVGGGVSLAHTPADVTILDVVNAVEPIQRIHTCPLGISTHGKRLCPLHKRLDAALATMEAAFAATTLAEVLADPSKSVPLCEVPPKSKAKTTRR
jgi:Rrf2 family protein